MHPCLWSTKVRPAAGILLCATVLAADACQDSTGLRNDDDPLTDNWKLAAHFTGYVHEGGPCGFVEHCAVTDSVAGPSLGGVLTIGNGRVSGGMSSRKCMSVDAAGDCAAYGTAEAVNLPSGTIDTTSTAPGELNITMALDERLSSGFTWTALYLRDVKLTGDSLTGRIFWADYPNYRAVQSGYSGTFVAHRQR